MNREPSRRGRRARRCGAALLLWLCLPLGGCGLLQDEFTWLDRAPPKAPAPLADVPAAQFVGH